MSKNTGKPTQIEFERMVAALGKRAFLYRFDDAAAIRGKTGAAGYAKQQPSDYLLVFNGVTSFVEVKSTEDPNAFRFGQLEVGQVAAGKMILAAGGTYDILIKSLLLDQWFKLPFAQLQQLKDAGKASTRWGELTRFGGF